MAWLTDAIKNVFTKDSNNNDAMRVLLAGGDHDLNGGQLLDEKSHLGLASATPFYRFDGTDDVITVTDNAALDFSTELSIVVFCRLASPGATRTLCSKYNPTGNKREFAWFFDTDETLKVFWGDPADGTLEGNTVTDSPISDYDKIAMYALTYNAGTVTMYRNAIALDTTDTTVPSSLYNSDAALQLFGNTSGAAGYFIGEGYSAAVLNRAITAAEAAAIYAAGPDGLESALGWSAVGASQVEMITDSDNTDFDDGTINEWVVLAGGGGNGTCVYDAGPGAEKTALVTVGATAGTSTGGQLPTANITTFVSGKQYRLTADVYIPSTNNNWTGISIGGSGFSGTLTTLSSVDATVTTEDEWQQIEAIVEFGSDVTGSIAITGSSTATGDLFYFDNISIKQLGIVANYPPKSFSAAYAYDTSGNGNNGAVTGATLIAGAVPANASNIPAYSVTSGITANANSSQGDTPLVSAINQIAVCGTGGDAVTLPKATPGLRIFVCNDGANSADVFPASGDDIDEAGANNAKALAADAEMDFICTSAGHWTTITSA